MQCHFYYLTTDTFEFSAHYLRMDNLQAQLKIVTFAEDPIPICSSLLLARKTFVSGYIQVKPGCNKQTFTWF